MLDLNISIATIAVPIEVAKATIEPTMPASIWHSPLQWRSITANPINPPQVPDITIDPKANILAVTEGVGSIEGSWFPVFSGSAVFPVEVFDTLLFYCV